MVKNIFIQKSKRPNTQPNVAFFFFMMLLHTYMYVCEKWMNAANYIIFRCICIGNLEVLEICL